jgi:hypothetical protein
MTAALEIPVTEEEEQELEALIRIADEFSDYCTLASKERWRLMETSIYESEVFEAIGGLIARQATLSSFLARSPISWNPHVAPLSLRAMVEVHITLAWILLDPKRRAEEFVAYGVGQEKLALAHLRQLVEDEPGRASELSEIISAKEAWLGLHKFEFLTEINLGSWSGKNLRARASEADCAQLYSLDYGGYSGSAHSMWQHLSIWNLEHCLNPLHKMHRVPSIEPTYLEVRFLMDSARYLSRTLKLVDDHFELSLEEPMPLDWLLDRLSRGSITDGDDCDS